LPQPSHGQTKVFSLVSGPGGGGISNFSFLRPRYAPLVSSLTATGWRARRLPGAPHRTWTLVSATRPACALVHSCVAGNFVTGNIGIGHLKTGQQSHLDNSVNAYDIDSQQPCYYPCPAIMPTPVRTGSPVDILPALKDGACRAPGQDKSIFSLEGNSEKSRTRSAMPCHGRSSKGATSSLSISAGPGVTKAGASGCARRSNSLSASDNTGIRTPEPGHTPPLCDRPALAPGTWLHSWRQPTSGFARA